MFKNHNFYITDCVFRCRTREARIYVDKGVHSTRLLNVSYFCRKEKKVSPLLKNLSKVKVNINI